MKAYYYKAYYWASSSSNLRLIVCDDLVGLEQSCKNAWGVGVTELRGRQAIHAAFSQAGKDCFLIIDGTLAEPVGLLGEANVMSAEQWCHWEPAFTAEEMASRIIVWSGDPPGKHGFLQWYQKSATPVTDLREMKSFGEKSSGSQHRPETWPSELSGETEKLSQVIHYLDNILLPIVLDVETLVAAPSTGEKMWSEYFGRGEGYLTEDYRGLDGLDIISCITGRLEELDKVSGVGREVTTERDNLLGAVRTVRTSQKKRTMETLETDLKMVLESGRALVKGLRELRGKRNSGKQ